MNFSFAGWKIYLPVTLAGTFFGLIYSLFAINHSQDTKDKGTFGPFVGSHKVLFPHRMAKIIFHFYLYVMYRKIFKLRKLHFKLENIWKHIAISAYPSSEMVMLNSFQVYFLLQICSKQTRPSVRTSYLSNSWGAL